MALFLQETYDYTAFGDSIGADTPSHYGFTGREHEETGLYYYRARFYMPDRGRFTSKDPIGFAGGDTNLYSYVGQNPVNFVDPWGLIDEYFGLAIGNPSMSLQEPIGPTRISVNYLDIGGGAKAAADAFISPVPLMSAADVAIQLPKTKEAMGKNFQNLYEADCSMLGNCSPANNPAYQAYRVVPKKDCGDK